MQKKLIYLLLIFSIFFIGVDVKAAQCYYCESGSSGSYYKWADSAPNSNCYLKSDKSQSECTGETTPSENNTEKCYYCENGSSGSYYSWSKKAPTNNCYTVDKVENECSGTTTPSANKTNKVYSCYHCESGQSYRWLDSNPNPNSCQLTERSESNCKADNWQSATTLKTVSCGGSKDIPSGLPILSSRLINTIKILVPIILILFAMIDLIKAVMYNNEKTLTDVKQKMVRRLISAIVIFLIVAFVQLAFTLLDDNTSNDVIDCMNCFINDRC